MEQGNYERAKVIISDIDDITNQAKLIEDTLYEIMDKGGVTKVYIYPKDGQQTTIDLSSDTTDTILRDVLKEYNSKICTLKSEMASILDRQTIKLKK